MTLLRTALTLLAVAWALMGCAAPTSLTAQVVSFGPWAAPQQPGPFVFDRLPSQAAEPAQQARQARLEAAALPALARAGFTLAADPSQAAYTVQLNAQTQVDRHPAPFGWVGRPGHPFVDPVWGPPWLTPMPWGPYRGPYPGLRGGPPGAPSLWLLPPPPPRAAMQVDLLLRERATGLVLYEAHALHDRIGAADPRLWQALLDAALLRFPATQAEPVDTEVPLAPPTPAAPPTVPAPGGR